MFIVEYTQHRPDDDMLTRITHHFAASKKDLPSLIEKIAETAGEEVNIVLNSCTYDELNTSLSREGHLDMSHPLSDVLKIRVSLIPTQKETPAKKEEADEGSED